MMTSKRAPQGKALPLRLTITDNRQTDLSCPAGDYVCIIKWSIKEDPMQMMTADLTFISLTDLYFTISLFALYFKFLAPRVQQLYLFGVALSITPFSLHC